MANCPHPTAATSLQAKASWHRWLLRLLNAALVANVVFGAANVFIGSALGLFHISDVGSLDSANLLRIRDVVHSAFLYPDFEQPPYLVTIYGPLTYVLLAVPYVIAETAGLSPLSVVRFTVFGTFVCCLVLGYRLGRRTSPTALAAIMGLLLFLSVSSLRAWTTQIRSDFLGLAFALAGMCVVLYSDRRRWLVVAATLAGLAMLTKQTFAAAPAAVFLWFLFYRRDTRRACLWIAFVGIVVALGMLATWLREPLVFRHLAALSSPVTDLRSGIQIGARALLRPLIPLAFFGGFLALFRGTAQTALLAIYGLTAWSIAFLTIPQIGGSVNYFWEPLLVSALLAGNAWWVVNQKCDKISNCVSVPLALTVIGLCFPRLAVEVNSLQSSHQAAISFKERKERWKSVTAVVSGRKLLSTLSAITTLAKCPEVPDPFLNSVLEIGGKWSFAPIIFAVNKRRYELVCVRKGDLDGSFTFRGMSMWSEGLRNAVLENYVLSCTFDGIEVWLPRDGSNELKVRLLSAGCSEPSPNTSQTVASENH